MVPVRRIPRARFSVTDVVRFPSDWDLTEGDITQNAALGRSPATRRTFAPARQHANSSPPETAGSGISPTSRSHASDNTVAPLKVANLFLLSPQCEFLPYSRRLACALRHVAHICVTRCFGPFSLSPRPITLCAGRHITRPFQDSSLLCVVPFPRVLSICGRNKQPNYIVGTGRGKGRRYPMAIVPCYGSQGEEGGPEGNCRRVDAIPKGNLAPRDIHGFPAH
ncbi:hypothetical protein VUR80DRAFT_4360 [Thermomyces stellatus]